MNDKDNYLTNAEPTTGQPANLNAPVAPPAPVPGVIRPPEEKPLDKVKPPRRSRTWELDR